MEPLDFWRLTEEVSVVQAALLIVAEDPSVTQHNIQMKSAADLPKGFTAALSALQNGVRSETIPATIRYEARMFKTYDERKTHFHYKTAEATGETVRIVDKETAVAFKTEPSWHLTVIRVEDLKAWLKMRGFSNGFFFPVDTETEPFLNKLNPFYAPKLAAAHFIWTTVTNNPDLLATKTPRQAMEKCLREHAGNFNLTHEDGNPNNSGIEEVCRVANWKPEGGAAPTPTWVRANPPTHPKSANKSRKK